MAYQSRSTRIKALAQTGPTMYWPTFSRPPSRQSADINSRHYIDPWDLENYAYIQSLEADDQIDGPINIPDSLASPYASSNVEECPCYAGLDEQLFYNAKYEMLPDDCGFSTITDVDGASTNSGSAESARRSNAMPEINFPPPPLQPSSAYEYYANVNPSLNRSQPMDSLPSDGFTYPSGEMLYESLPIDYPQNPYGTPEMYQQSRRRRLSRPPECYECLEQLQHMPLYQAPNSVRDSAAVADNVYAPYDQRFGLSKKGLLQIDYSLSWMNLQRLMTTNK